MQFLKILCLLFNVAETNFGMSVSSYSEVGTPTKKLPPKTPNPVLVQKTNSREKLKNKKKIELQEANLEVSLIDK